MHQGYGCLLYGVITTNMAVLIRTSYYRIHKTVLVDDKKVARKRKVSQLVRGKNCALQIL